MVSGVGKQVISCICSLLFLLPGKSQDSRVYRYNSGNIQNIDYSFTDEGDMTINYSIGEINLKEFASLHGSFFRISVSGHMPSSEAGKPELPVFSKLIALKNIRGYKIKISEVKSVRISPGSKRIRGVLYPSQETDIKREAVDKPFRYDRAAYSTRGFINSDTVRIEYLGKMRNENLANIFITPVRYKPKSNVVEVITSMKIEIKFTDHTSALRSASKESFLFNESLSKGIINYNKEVIPGFTDKPVGMIILTDTIFKNQLKPFIQWKTQKGFKVQVLYKGKGYAGSTWTELQDTLKGIYSRATDESPAPEYLLIVGDVNYIPYYGAGGSGNVTDMYYGEFTGNGDYIPEMFTGRLPVKDTIELNSVLSKIIQYEKFQFPKTEKFYSNALASAGSDAGYASYMNGQVKYSVTNYFTGKNKLNEKHFYYPQDLNKQKDSVLKIINAGTSFINYTGHGDASGWLHLDIKVADTSALKNKSRYPFIVSNACQTARFNQANSFGNRMVLEKNRGAIGFIGCSNDSFWDEDYYWAVGAGTITENPVYEGKGLGMIDRMFHTHQEYPGDWYFTMGQVNFAGNLSVSASNSLRKKYYWETYNLIGDPSMIPIIGSPDTFNISVPRILPNGIRTLMLTSEPFSYVAISHFDKLWDASFAGASGSVTLDLPGVSDDSCLLVITGQNKIPLIRTLYFSKVQEEFLNLTSAVVNDISGNNNKKADFGESIFLALKLSNPGGSDASTVSVKITTPTSWLTMLTDSVYIGNLQAGGEIYIPDKIQMKVSDFAPDLGISTLDLTFSSSSLSVKHYRIDLVLHSPDLEIVNYLIDDATTGNGDHIADPGETFYMVFRIANHGSSDTEGKFSMSSTNAGFSIFDNSLISGILKAGQTTEIPILVKVSENLSSGSFLSVSSNLSSLPRSIAKDFTLRIGRLRESFEAQSFEIFPWINSASVPWIITASDSYEGVLSARSGVTSHSGNSTLILRTYYTNADTLKFYYKVSSEPNYDFLTFKLNDKVLLSKSGETGWAKMIVAVPKGLNRMEWKYSKDISQYGGYDCAWIDMIDFATSGSVNFLSKDLEVAGITSPEVREQYNMEPLTVKVVNVGKEIINGFNLGYIINGRSMVKEFFDTKVYPGKDSVTVTFKNKIDLSRYGTYKISVFGTGNDDDYLLNDSLKIEVQNMMITESLNVFPNPFRSQINLVVFSESEEDVMITISNLGGSIFYSTKKKLITGQNLIILNDLNFKPGIYYLSVKGKLTDKAIPVIRALK